MTSISTPEAAEIIKQETGVKYTERTIRKYCVKHWRGTIAQKVGRDWVIDKELLLEALRQDKK